MISKISLASIDIGVTEIMHPEEFIYDAGIEYIEVVVENFGDESASDFYVQFYVVGSPVVSEFISFELLSGDTMHYLFETPIDLSALGMYVICAYTYFISDSNFSNDTHCKGVNCVAKIVDLGDAEIIACDSILLDAGNEGATYLWSTGETTQSVFATESATYWVQVTPTGSIYFDSDSINVTIIFSPDVNFSYTIVDGIFYFENNSIYSISYTWDFGDGSFSFDENPMHNYLLEGNYLVSLSASNECGTNIYTTEISTTTQINSTDSKFDIIQTYPNPTDQFLFIKNFSYFQSIELYSSIGEKIPFSYDENGIDVSNLIAGIYFLICDLKMMQFVIQ